MNFWTALHWLAYFGILACAVSALMYAGREIGAWWRAR